MQIRRLECNVVGKSRALRLLLFRRSSQQYEAAETANQIAIATRQTGPITKHTSATTSIATVTAAPKTTTQAPTKNRLTDSSSAVMVFRRFQKFRETYRTLFPGVQMGYPSRRRQLLQRLKTSPKSENICHHVCFFSKRSLSAVS